MNRHHFTRAAILGAALALCAASSHAQTATNELSTNAAVSANAASDARTIDIPLSNLPVGIVAYWLDPKGQSVPLQIQQSRNYANSSLSDFGQWPREPGDGNGPRDLKLPAGIQGIVAVDARNLLRATGTATGTEELKKLVAGAGRAAQTNRSRGAIFPDVAQSAEDVTAQVLGGQKHIFLAFAGAGAAKTSPTKI